MAFIAHLFGSIGPLKSVGKGGENNPMDVKIVKALLNVYLHSKNQPRLPIDGSTANLALYIENFQKEKLNAPKPDGRVDPGGKTLASMLQHLRGRYTVAAVTPPTAGRLTWDAEGDEGGRFHSRRLHVPDGNSGLTLGRGFDLRDRVAATVQADLANAGLASNMALKVSAAAGKRGTDASRFVVNNDLLDFEITPQAQLNLFSKVYGQMLADVKRISNANDSVRLYGKADWGKLDQRILDVLVDLRYRGDYTRSTRMFLQKHVAANDFAKFKIEIAKKSNWPDVPQARFERRKSYVEATV